MVDGLTSLAQYTGTVLALQDSADVPFPNLKGGTADLFAPGDDLLALLATAASAQIVCGASPGDPPIGVAAPGDAVYCQATTADGLGAISGACWTLHGPGTVDHRRRRRAIGSAPTGTVKITGSDGEPDLQVDFTAGGEPLTARSTPRTVQEVVNRVKEIDGSAASAHLREGRLDVDVKIVQAEDAADLPLGNADTLGALVGLTGLRTPKPPVPQDPDAPQDPPPSARATAEGASFDVGFGIQTGTPADGESRQTYLLPQDASLLRIDDLKAAAPDGLTGLPARIGFLGVKADVTGLSLGHSGSGPAVEPRPRHPGRRRRDRSAGHRRPLRRRRLPGPRPARAHLRGDRRDLVHGHREAGLRADLRHRRPTARRPERSPSPGTAPVSRRSPQDAGYTPLRVFDPVPARFLAGHGPREPGTGDRPPTRRRTRAARRRPAARRARPSTRR